jgi:hypothetical protein
MRSQPKPSVLISSKFYGARKYETKFELGTIPRHPTREAKMGDGNVAISVYWSACVDIHDLSPPGCYNSVCNPRFCGRSRLLRIIGDGRNKTYHGMSCHQLSVYIHWETHLGRRPAFLLRWLYIGLRWYVTNVVIYRCQLEHSVLGLGSLIGPTIGSSLWRLTHRRTMTLIDTRERDFYQRIAKNRVDPSYQSPTNPIPDFYGSYPYFQKFCPRSFTI